MQDKELYRQILGIQEPWFVESVDLRLVDGEIHVHLDHRQEVEWKCPDCSKVCGLYDHQPERRWRHLDTCQFQTILHAKVPRTDCSEHGAQVVRLPWAEPGSRFTALFEALAVEWLKQASQSAVSKRLKMSWDEVHSIMHRAVKRGMERRQQDLLPTLAIDEKAYRKGHDYVTIVTDATRSRVLYVAEAREEKSLNGFWETLNPQQLNSIKAISLDMWEAYLNSIRKHVPDADEKIVFDKFHIAQHLTDAVDRVRRTENKELNQVGDSRLKGTRFSWLRNPVNLGWHERRRFTNLKNSHLKSARAWALKQAAMQLFDYIYEGAARKHFRWWYGWAMRSRLVPMKKVAGMMKRRFENIVTYLRHRITNAISESINAKLQWVKYTARGFRNKQNFMTAIYFHAGGLDMTPSPTK